ncbi:unnamed protein product [Brassicogethes aeneus]|uniref:FERM domain-containing protein n=1 Tax=Brassicogethes aeneus TaxID=1431903 RepID=A0A9P0FKF4_BRAAE|nr:unnamed protein product [Brassicogethes aeneus]
MSGDEACISIVKSDVVLLTNEIITCEYTSQEKGEDLLDKICRFQKINEPFHFGLKFKDINGSMKWLHMQKLITTQVNCRNIKFYFQVQFYPILPNDICDVHTRHNLYLQLRRDFHESKFIISPSVEVFLTAVLMQLDLGDKCNYDKNELYMYQPKIIHEEAKALHEKMKGISAFEAQECFLVTIGNIDGYGMEVHEVRDSENNVCHIGANFCGISVFKNRNLKDIMNWVEIEKFLWEDEIFIIVLHGRNSEAFNCGTKSKCFYIWKQVMDHLIHFCITNEDRETQLSGVRDMLNNLGDASSVSTILTDKSLKPLNEVIANFLWDVDQQIEEESVKSISNVMIISEYNFKHNDFEDYNGKCQDLVGQTYLYFVFFVFVIIFAIKSDVLFMFERIK